jgi:GcrA cell cycle regulator
MGFVWTDDHVGEMRRLLKDGLSCTQVGARLGCSRNAVIGKVHRIEKATGESWFRAKGTRHGPQVRVPGAEPRKRPARAETPRLVLVSPPSEPKPPPPSPRRAQPLPGAITLKGEKPVAPGTECGILQASGCRWAVGHDHTVIGHHIFCNAEVAEGQRYCEVHRKKNVSAITKAAVLVRRKAERRFA